jgi:hypothetical protein
MRSNELIWLQNHAEEFTFSCCDTWDKGWFFYMLWNNRTFKKSIYKEGCLFVLFVIGVFTLGSIVQATLIFHWNWKML